MPGWPEEGYQVFETPAGPVQAITHGVQSTAGAYVVVYADYPPDLLRGDNTEVVLNGACLGMVMNVRGIIRSCRNVELGDIAGYELEYEFPRQVGTPRGYGRARVFLIQDRLYQVFVIGTAEMVESAAARTFLESFRIEGRAPIVIAGSYPIGPTRPGGSQQSLKS
ncbi:MAG: hypothetical protein P4L84_26030 [Isosphaeraceae bacterium]|nr:hypothetical protein [Isosphaeraceae bacterium]